MGKLIEGLWDCTYCKTKGVGGSKQECPNCGHVRDNNTVFYVPKGKRIYVSDEIAKKINKNPDWLCEYCGYSLNPDDAKTCISCGAERTSENLNYFENRRKQKQELDEETSTIDLKSELEFSSAAVKETDEDILKQDSTKQEDTQSVFCKFERFIKKNKIQVISIIAALAVILGIVYLLIPKEKQITITQTSWNRSIEIQQYKTVEENAWTLPVQARLLYQRQEIYDYEQVLDHYETKTKQVEKERIVGYEEQVVGMEDLGNGYFEQITEQVPIYETYYEYEEYQEPVYVSVPVYKIKYYYEIDKWLYERRIATSGNDKTPYWGEVILQEDERKGNSNETYTIAGTDEKGKMYKVDLSYQQWQEVNVDDNVKVKIHVTGNGEILQ